MTARIRILLLALTIVYCAIFGPGAGLARPDHAHRLPWPKPHRPRFHRARAPGHAPEALGVRAARYARRLLGIPYRWGGDSPAGGFDCSGLVRYVYAHFGLNLPHSTYADFDLGRRVSRGALRPGDLVFFDGVGHVGMYIGAGRFIHAPHTGTTVQVTSLSEPWYRATYDGARRLFAPSPHRTRRAAPSPREALRAVCIHVPRLGLF
jgi:cell wall-associated NlpC family hydrolase